MAVAELTSKVELFLEASGLPNLDVGSKTDAFAVIEMKGATGPWVRVDQTEVVYDNANPKFAKQIIIDYRFEETQHLRVVLWDADVSTAHDYIGEIEPTTVGRLMGSRGSALTLPIARKQGRPLSAARMRTATLTIRGSEIKGGGNDIVRFQFRACNLDKKDFFGSSDPFYVFSRLRPDGSRTKVLEGPVIKKDLNPVWKTQDIPVQLLCNGDWAAPIVVQVWDWDSDGGHDLIGEFVCTLRDLVEAPKASRQFPLIRDKKVGRKGYSNSGLFMVASATVTHVPTFLEYIQGGCGINLMVAVDYTGSNGHPLDAGSLHFINPVAPNEYLQAITACGQVLLDYDADKRVPVYGFGGMVDGGATSHCFALNFNERDPEVPGLQGLVDAYKGSFSRVTLSGPTYFAPIIRRAAEVASVGISAASQKYTILLLLTDGAVNDLDETVRAIVDASVLPLSIVIIGVGGADFSTMDFLDADKGRLSAGGKVAARDIVQFVPFRKYGAYGPVAGSMLAKELLKEVPAQLVAAFMARGIMPNPPPAVAPLAVPAVGPYPGAAGAGAGAAGGAGAAAPYPGGFAGPAPGAPAAPTAGAGGYPSLPGPGPASGGPSPYPGLPGAR